MAVFEYNKNSISDNAQVLKLLSQVTREILWRYYYMKKEFLIMQTQTTNGFIYTNKRLAADIELSVSNSIFLKFTSFISILLAKPLFEMNKRSS